MTACPDVCLDREAAMQTGGWLAHFFDGDVSTVRQSQANGG